MEETLDSDVTWMSHEESFDRLQAPQRPFCTWTQQTRPVALHKEHLISMSSPKVSIKVARFVRRTVEDWDLRLEVRDDIVEQEETSRSGN